MCFAICSFLRKGGNVTNPALVMSGIAETPQNTPSAGKGKQLTFPMLQAGADPFSTVLSYATIHEIK